MLNSVHGLKGAILIASDGEIGHVTSAFFDDQSWTVRYLAVDTGSWLSGRSVLISPYSAKRPMGDSRTVELWLTREQVRNSPVTDTHQPVSRRHERETLGYYAYPEYWNGGDLWAMSGFPLVPAALPALPESDAAIADRERAVAPEDVHLRSSAQVTGYDIHATDGSIGHVSDFIFDDASWAIRYLVVDTRNWWPGGKKVLLAPRWIDRIEWAERMVYTPLTREQVKASPEYDEKKLLDRDYEQRLHDAYGRPGYWD